MRTTILTLCLVMLAGSAWAVPVDLNSPDGVASFFTEDDFFFAVLTDGTVYTFEFEGWNAWRFWGDLSAFPLTEIIDYRGRFIQKSDGTWWGVRYAQHPANQTTWVQLDPFPQSGVVPSKSSNFGNTKALYR